MTKPSDRGQAVIDVAGLSKVFGRGAHAVAAVRDVTFSLHPGDTVGLLGANGSGKSTTMRLVLGLLKPTGGRVEAFGGEAGRRTARRRTGFVPEEARRFGRLTGRETVDLFGRLQGVGPRAERRRRVEEALSLVGLPQAAWRRRVGAYSRGMTRRLALAAAWVHRPELLVLDEPTAGLDPPGTEEILALLERHRDEGGALLLSTHDRVTAVGACARAVVLSGGRKALEGSMADLLGDDTSPSLSPLIQRAEATYA
ncbi:MAG: ABC transporter ATP-binding protein [Planctomycetota bacterium]|nr:ABC transporter ATP-binding protein [Planctomycetota bacterium]